MSIAAFAVAEASVAQAAPVAEKKAPPKRTIIATADAVLLPEAR